MRSVSVGRRPAITSSSSRELRRGCERTRDFEPLAVGQGQRFRHARAFVEQIELTHHVMCRCSRLRRIGGAQERADHDVVFHGQRRERPHDLERACDAAAADLIRPPPIDAFALKRDRAIVRLQRARNHVEQRGLAGAVGPDHREDLAALDLEACAIDRHQPPETLRHAGDGKQRAHERRSSPRRRATHGQMPSGSAITTISRQIP